jgi:hypothetical protein
MGAPYPFPSRAIALKVQRADKHREDLLRCLQGYRDRRPYQIRKHIESWEGRAYLVVTAYGAEPLPDEVPVLLGDFIQNLRSSLDYLVGVMRRDGPSRVSAFPICTRRNAPNGFLQISERKLADIPRPAKELIERMQPYDRRYGRPGLARVRWESLATLQALWNIEKHRTILLATTLLAPDYVTHNRTGEQGSGIAHRVAPSQGEADWWLPIDERDQSFDPHFGIEISLTKPRGFAEDWPPGVADIPLDGLVQHLYQKVAYDVLPHFRQYVQGGF